MIYDIRSEERFSEVVKRIESIYDLRSRLVHGTLSPFDPEVRHRRYKVLTVAEKALVKGLNLYDQDGLFDRPQTKRQPPMASSTSSLGPRTAPPDAGGAEANDGRRRRATITRKHRG